jgi:hypothetical protein
MEIILAECPYGQSACVLACALGPRGESITGTIGGLTGHRRLFPPGQTPALLASRTTATPCRSRSPAPVIIAPTSVDNLTPLPPVTTPCHHGLYETLAAIARLPHATHNLAPAGDSGEIAS